jgi:hypothetical protein
MLQRLTHNDHYPVQAYPDGSADSLPPALKSFPSYEISQACSCLNIPTPSVTATVTVDALSILTITDKVSYYSSSYHIAKEE